jgi:hypothetical protein
MPPHHSTARLPPKEVQALALQTRLDSHAPCALAEDEWARLGNDESWSATEALSMFRLLGEANLRMFGTLTRINAGRVYWPGPETRMLERMQREFLKRRP